MKEQLEKEYEKLLTIQKQYAISIEQLDEYHEIQHRIKQLRNMINEKI